MWKIFCKPFKNVQKIFPTKQKYIAKMVEICKSDPNIKKVIIFGSTVTAGCNPWSDIDIYFEVKDKSKKLPGIKSHTQAFDKWSNFTVDQNLLNEIKKEGVIVYER